MAKSQKSEEPIVLMDESEQLERMAGDIYSVIEHTIECCCCGTGYSRSSRSCVSEAEAAQQLFNKGWRYVHSKKFEMIGAMCPECAAESDDNRGEG